MHPRPRRCRPCALSTSWVGGKGHERHERSQRWRKWGERASQGARGCYRGREGVTGARGCSVGSNGRSGGMLCCWISWTKLRSVIPQKTGDASHAQCGAGGPGRGGHSRSSRTPDPPSFDFIYRHVLVRAVPRTAPFLLHLYLLLFRIRPTSGWPRKYVSIFVTMHRNSIQFWRALYYYGRAIFSPRKRSKRFQPHPPSPT
eukprot:3980241-Prymnesium_polylepis.1